MRVGAREWLVGLALLLAAGTALAHPAVDAARGAYEDGSFAVALARLDEAEKDPALNRAELTELYWLRAASQHALGRRALADKTFDQLVQWEPLFEPSPVDASPVLQAAYEKRRALYRKDHEVTLAAPELGGGADVAVRVEKHPDEVAVVVVFARPKGDVTFKAFPLGVTSGRAEGPLRDAALWDQAGRAGGMEVVLEARSVRQGVVARRGTAKEPLVVAVTAAQGKAAQSQLRALPDAGDAQPQAPAPAGTSRTLPPVAVPAAPGTAPPAVPAPAGRPVIPALLLGSGGALLAAGGVGVLAAAAAAVLSAGAYAGMWLYPRTPGADASPAFRTLLGTWLGGLVAGGLLALLALGLGATGVAAGATGAALR